jgi:splicing factor 3A subunit 1
VAYAQIDWHDFVVVETVLFTEADDQAKLPPPTSLSDLQSASLEQKATMSLAPHNMRIEEAMPTDDELQHDAYGVQQQQPSPAQAASAFQLPAPPPPEATTPMDIDGPFAAAAENAGADEARRIQERSDARARARQAQMEAKGGAGPMKIRSDYVPRAAAQANSRRGVQIALCPNCKQQIPFDELDEHMRSTRKNNPPSSHNISSRLPHSVVSFHSFLFLGHVLRLNPFYLATCSLVAPCIT